MKYYIPGWQSWTPCNDIYNRTKSCFYSPHGITSWSIEERKNLKEPIKGWCSWYAYGFNISEDKILQNAFLLTKLFNTNNTYIIIDDGWTKNGDWNSYSQARFPRGIRFVTHKINKLKLKAGLRISPFLADTNSKLAIGNPDYFIKNLYHTTELHPSFRLKIPFTKKLILNPEKTGVLKFIKKMIAQAITDNNIDLLKLDFLYAPYFNPVYKTSKIPDQILHELLFYIKTNFPNLFVTCSGCPLGPAAGVVDAMRISNDTVGPYWDGIWPFNRLYNLSMVNQLEENLTLRPNFEKIWLIDPDVLVVRKSTGLSSSEIRRFFNLINGKNKLFFLGDDLTNRSIFAKIKGLIGKTSHIAT